MQFIDRHDVVGELDVQRHITNLVACRLSLDDDGVKRRHGIIQSAPKADRAVQSSVENVILEVRNRKERAHVTVLDVQDAVKRLRFEIRRAFHRVGAAVLLEADILGAQHICAIDDLAVHGLDRLSVESKRLCIEHADEFRRLQRTRDMPGKRAVAADRIRQPAAEAVEAHIVHIGIEVKRTVARDRAVEVDVDERGEDMEVLQAHDAVLQIIVAVHAREDIAIVAAAIEMDVADRRRIVERAREADRIVDIARDRLVGSDESRDVLHARTNGIDAQVDAPLTRKADAALGDPRLLARTLHGEAVNGDAVGAAVHGAVECVERLMEETSRRSLEIRLNGRIRRVAAHCARDVEHTRSLGLWHKGVDERQRQCRTVKAQVERRAAPHVTLDNERAARRKRRVEVIKMKKLPLLEERCGNLLGRNAAEGRALARKGAVSEKICQIRPLAAQCDVRSALPRQGKTVHRQHGGDFLARKPLRFDVCAVGAVRRAEHPPALERASQGSCLAARRQKAVLVVPLCLHR